MKILIVGMGEIGKALREVLSKYYSDISTTDIRDKIPLKIFEVDVLHICYPYSTDFLPVTNDYIRNYKPKLTIIHTTTSPGTVGLIHESLQQIVIPTYVVYAPIRGQHKNLAKGIQEYPMFVGGEKSEALKSVQSYLSRANIKTYPVDSFRAAELIKLLSLAQYGINIEFARYAKKCCDKLDIPYNLFNDYLRTENEYLSYVSGKDVGKNHQRFILEPPEGKIGGHCVLQGMEKLNNAIPEKFISCLIEGNHKLAE